MSTPGNLKRFFYLMHGSHKGLGDVHHRQEGVNCPRLPSAHSRNRPSSVCTEALPLQLFLLHTCVPMHMHVPIYTQGSHNQYDMKVKASH